MKPKVVVLIILAFILGSTIASYSQNPEQLYQKALVKEEGEGALQEAIYLFTQVADNTEAGIPLQAKALLHVGLCYEKLGKQEAMKAYQRLVSNYPGQKQEVAIASQRLSMLILQNQKAEEIHNKKVVEKKLLNRKVWAEDDTDLLGEISPDGKYLSYIDWETGDLAIYEVETGNKRRVTNKGTWEESDEYTEYCRWFPDSKKLAYVWFNDENYTELRTINIENSTPEILIKNEAIKWMEVYDCSSDGNYILACFTSANNNARMVRISASDGSYEVLKTFNSRWPHCMNFSPDGKYIVYDLPRKENDDKGDIHLMTLLTKSETVLVEYPEDDRVLGWIPNTDFILITSDRTGSPDIWRIEVNNGMPVHEPVRIMNIKGPFVPISLGFTNNGSFYYGNHIVSVNVKEIEIDPETGKMVKQSSKAVKKFLGSNVTPDFSPDGNFMAYVSRRPPGTMEFTTNHVGNVLCIRSLETGEEREFRPTLNVFGWPSWSFDSKSVVVVNFSKQNKYSYYQINIDGGELKPILITQGRDLYGGHYLSEDEKLLYFGRRNQEANQFNLVARNIQEKTEDILYGSDDKIGISLSPDGKVIAIISNIEKCIKLIDTEKSEILKILKLDYLGDCRLETWGVPICWNNEGKFIFFVIERKIDDKSEYELCRISVESEILSRAICTSKSRFVNLSAHPDGRRIIYSDREELGSEVWVMENYIQPEKLAQKEEAKEPEGITIQQLPEFDGVDFGTFSHDGNYFSMMDGETGNVALYELRTKKKHVLTKEGSWDHPMQYANLTKLSHDNKKVAYSWQKVNKGNKFDLRVVDIDNSNPRTIYEAREGEVHPAFWTSDDNNLIAYTIRNDTCEIFTFNLASESFKKLHKYRQPTGLPTLCFSSDEKFIAYNYLNPKNNQYDIYLIPAKGGKEFPLINHPANDRILGWLPTRKELIFLSERRGSWDIWSVPVLNGKVSGPYNLLYRDIGKISTSAIAENGTLYFSKFTRRFNSFYSPFNIHGNIVDFTSSRFLIGSNYAVKWSPDSKSVAYNKEISEPQGVSWQLTLRDEESGNERHIAKNLNTGPEYSWSPDGKQILTMGVDKRKSSDKNYFAGIYKVDVKTGVENELITFSRESFTSPSMVMTMTVEWAPDGKGFYYSKEKQIVHYDIETGKQKIFHESDKFLNYLILSPSGNELVFKEGNKIIIASVEDEKKIFVDALENSKFKIVDWSSDEAYLYLMDKGCLCKIPAAGGDSIKICDLPKNIRYVAIRPDEKEIVVTTYDQQNEFRQIMNLDKELNKIYSLND